MQPYDYEMARLRIDELRRQASSQLPDEAGSLGHEHATWWNYLHVLLLSVGRGEAR